MSDSPKFEYPELSDQQDRAEDTHNLANRRTEALLGGVVNRTQSFPTGSETEGTAYIVRNGLGQFSGLDDHIVFLAGGAWQDIAPVYGGCPVYVVAEDTYVHYNGNEWVTMVGTQTLVESAAIAWDVSGGTTANVTLTADRTIDAPANLIPGRGYTLEIVQDGTGGHSITSWDAAYDFPGGTPPVLTGTAGSRDFFVFIATSSSTVVLVTQSLNVS